MFTGQLSIGWSNDAIDAAQGPAPTGTVRQAGRPGGVSRRTVATAAVVALIATVSCSLVLGSGPVARLR